MATLNIRSLTVKFGGVTAVQDVTFSAYSENIVGLIGPNGAGKSTLFNCISGIIRPTSGSITLDGNELAGRPTHQIAAAGIGRVFQHPELVPHYTVLENLLLGCHRDLSYGLVSEIFSLPLARRQEAAARDRAVTVLAEVGLEGELQQLVARLPYGHRKLVELARSLLSAQKFLLLDEPVAGLNEAEIDRMAQTVLGVCRRRGMGVILVEHNMGLVSQLCDDVVVLDLGGVIAHGSPATVLKSPAVMVAYLGQAA